MIIKILICLFFVMSHLLAAVPTIEGLMRHPANSEVTSSNTILRLKLSDLASDEEETSSNSSFYVKYFFNSELKSKIRLLQVVYTDKSMSDKSIINVNYIDDIKSPQLPRERRLLYAIMSSLLLNRSNELSLYIKELSKDYKTNDQLINTEKKNLILSYKNYLKDKNENKDLDQNNNPLKSTDTERRQRVSEIMSRSYYIRDNAISLERVDGDFVWRVTLEHFKGYFLNEVLQMKKLEFDNLSGLDIVSMDQYLLFDGIHEFPKKIKLNLSGVQYELSTMNLRHIESTRKSISSRHRDYKKKMTKLKLVNNQMSHSLL